MESSALTKSALKGHETLKHIFWDVNIYEQVAHQWKQQERSLCLLLREKWLFFRADLFFQFKKQCWTNITKSDVYLCVNLDEWLAGEYASTSLFSWAFLSIIHEN